MVSEIREPVIVVEGGRILPHTLSEDSPVLAVVIGSTRTSTIPGISIAGPTPEATLLTPTLDVEYVATGKPRTLDVVPVTPDGIPTPALITRASLGIAWDAILTIVDAGAYKPPLIPHTALPSRTVGGRIDVEPGLEPARAKALFEEARVQGRLLGRKRVVMVGESIPGGTTTALAILLALGVDAEGKVSSSGPENPHELKAGVARRAAERASRAGSPIEAAALAGDPVHIAIAGLVQGALEAPARTVILAGGTQMAAPLAILSRLGVGPGRLAVVTTRWVLEDPQSDWRGLVQEAMPGVEMGAVMLDFSRAPHEGLRAYERGYAKEGVAAGGSAALAAMRAGLDRVHEQVYMEYWRLVSGLEG